MPQGSVIVQPPPGERPTIGQRIGASLGQRIAARKGMYAPPAAPVPNAAPSTAPMPLDPNKLPDGIRPQPDEREDAAPLPSLPSLPSLPTLPSLPSLPWLTRTANMQRVKPKESTEDIDG